MELIRNDSGLVSLDFRSNRKEGCVLTLNIDDDWYSGEIELGLTADEFAVIAKLSDVINLDRIKERGSK